METESIEQNSDQNTQQQTNQELEEEEEPISETDVKDQEQDEEETECGFCLFMKGGGCKDTFIVWEKCVEEAEKNKEDVVDKCFEATSALKKCMEAHPDYYGPLLKAEKAAENEESGEGESENKEKAADNEESGAGESENKGKEESLNGSELKD